MKMELSTVVLVIPLAVTTDKLLRCIKHLWSAMILISNDGKREIDAQHIWPPTRHHKKTNNGFTALSFDNLIVTAARAVGAVPAASPLTLAITAICLARCALLVAGIGLVSDFLKEPRDGRSN